MVEICPVLSSICFVLYVCSFLIVIIKWSAVKCSWHLVTWICSKRSPDLSRGSAFTKFNLGSCDATWHPRTLQWTRCVVLLFSQHFYVNTGAKCFISVCSHNTHTTVLWLCEFCPEQPGWASAKRNIYPLTPITHTHNRFTALWILSGITRVSRYQKGKTNLDFTEARDNEWQWSQLAHVQRLLPSTSCKVCGRHVGSPHPP